jgi:hypothetical protein
MKEIYESLATEMERAAAQEVSSKLPKVLPLGSLTSYPELFQPKDGGLDELLIHDLVKLLKAKRKHEELDAILVKKIGDQNVILDGHHRAAAYERAGRTRIPVKYHKGTIADAVLVASKANSRLKRQMTPSERQNHAWKLVRLGVYSKSQIADAAGVSERNVAYMRTTAKELGERAEEATSWQRAQWLLKDAEPKPATHADRVDWIEERAESYAVRIRKEFGTKLTDNNEITARALEIYFGRRLPDILEHLDHHIPESRLQELYEETHLEVDF